MQRANGPTAILGEYSEPQPDVAMRIEEASGGQSIIDATGYLVGAAELFMEASDSSLPLDLGAKKEDYREAGVIEYLVADLRGRRFHWFDLRAGETLEPDKKGIYRSRVFPGFWIDSRAFFTRCWTRA